MLDIYDAITAQAIANNVDPPVLSTSYEHGGAQIALRKDGTTKYRYIDSALLAKDQSGFSNQLFNISDKYRDDVDRHRQLAGEQSGGADT